MEFATMSLCQKDSPWSGNTLSGKEKVLNVDFSKGGHADSLLRLKRLIAIDFLEIGSTVNSASFLLPTPLATFTFYHMLVLLVAYKHLLFIEWPFYLLVS